ncbi:class II aldolase/adducin family protein [soil metagenome]
MNPQLEEQQVDIQATPPASAARICVQGEPSSPTMAWFASGVEQEMKSRGHISVPADEEPTFVLNLTKASRPRAFRRNSQGTFVASVIEVDHEPAEILKEAYPLLIRSMSNLLIYITRGLSGMRTHFVTLEQGYYTIEDAQGDDAGYFREVYERLAPLATTRLVINNEFRPDLPPELWQGNERTRALMDAGRRLDDMNLLPASFPIEELLGTRDMSHLRRLFGIGGLSYGNLSVREDADSFWMTARGVNKGNLKDIGRDVLLIRDYNPDNHAMVVSVPPNVEPRAASVDAVEHWCLYEMHPEIGAIIHVHAWLEGVASTRVNYPCGTRELAQEVAELVAEAPDPSRTVVGLKNHGLTITGHSLEDIFDRIEGKILRTVPME